MNNQSDTKNLGSLVAKGASWIVAARFSIRFLGFINTIIIARLLVPDDFGLIAIGVTTMQMLQGFTDVGVSQAVIRFRDANRQDLNTLFTFSALRGIFVALLLLAIAPIAANFYEDPRVGWVFMGVAIYPLVLGFINPAFYEFERNLDYTKDFIVTTVNKLAGVIVSIAIAFTFRSYWAIILGMVTGGLVQLTLSYIMKPFSPRFTFASHKKVLGFSGWITGVSFMAALNNKLDALIVARFANTDDAGNYYIGVRLSEMPSAELASPIARAIYPGFSALHGRADEMKKAYLRGVQAMSIIALPASFGFAFVASDLVQLLLGQKWMNAAPVIAIIAPVTGLQTLFLATQFYAIARDKTKLVFYREFFFFFLRTPAMVWATIEYGLMGAVYACATMGIVHTLLNLTLYTRVSEGKIYEPLIAAHRSLLGAAAMSAYFFLLVPQLTFLTDAPSVIRLAINISLGAGIYLSTMLLIWRAEGKPSGVERSIIDMASKKFAQAKRSA